ncbi:MAG: serine/threonine protein kinase, partial [Desulfobacterales bacterium]|nr:serine/threonine protein kinase [Desulfobacterales bacterium]
MDQTMADIQPIYFGKYELLKKIATGGMAELYLARITGFEGFEKRIVIKKILPHLSTEEDLINAFIEEAKLAAFLHHQNIVQVYDFGCMDGEYFIAMEHLVGKDLRDIGRKAKEKNLPLSLENALFITSRICMGLEYARNLKDFNGAPLNIIHRDISPQNILITREGEVKIVDFGIAKAVGRLNTTRVGKIKGKISYMSPEQAQGKAVDHRSDLFSTGILLYEMVTRRRMFPGREAMQILSKV